MGNYYSQRIVAFVDILGFKDKVEKAVELDLEAEKLHKALLRIYQMKSDNENDGVLNKRIKKSEINRWSFSLA